jgi:glucose uptake protein
MGFRDFASSYGAQTSMFLPATFAAALLMIILSTICWGSWANTFKTTRNYRFELFYFDYGLGIFLISLVLAFTLGSHAGGPTALIANIHQATISSLLYAAIGGFGFNIANVLLVAAIDMVGLAIVFPLAIGIALVEGTAISYLIHPAGNATLLFAGVAMALVAVIFIGFAYAARGIVGAVPTRKGIVVCLVSGVLMGAWAPFLAKSFVGTGIAGPQGTMLGGLTPYTGAVFMTLGALLCCFVFNPFLMRKPLVGAPVKMRGYFSARGSYHLIGLLGGCIWGLGTTLNLVAGGKVGLPISYAIGQASPMIATLWGVLVWKEFAGARPRAKLYLVAMFASYFIALVLISSAYSTT